MAFVIAAGIAAVTALCWLWIAPMARHVRVPMTGASAWMMTATWDLRYTLLIWAMWGAFVLFETLAPFGVHTARLAGAALIGLGFWIVAG